MNPIILTCLIFILPNLNNATVFSEHNWPLHIRSLPYKSEKVNF